MITSALDFRRRAGCSSRRAIGGLGIIGRSPDANVITATKESSGRRIACPRQRRRQRTSSCSVNRCLVSSNSSKSMSPAPNRACNSASSARTAPWSLGGSSGSTGSAALRSARLADLAAARSRRAFSRCCFWNLCLTHRTHLVDADGHTGVQDLHPVGLSGGCRGRSDGADVARFFALAARADLELDRLTLGERLLALTLDVRHVRRTRRRRRRG